MTSQPSAQAALPTIVNPPALHDPSPNGYSTAVVAPAGARLAFVSGQGGQDATGALSPDFAAQVKQAYANLLAVLAGIEQPGVWTFGDGVITHPGIPI